MCQALLLTRIARASASRAAREPTAAAPPRKNAGIKLVQKRPRREFKAEDAREPPTRVERQRLLRSDGLLCASAQSPGNASSPRAGESTTPHQPRVSRETQSNGGANIKEPRGNFLPSTPPAAAALNPATQSTAGLLRLPRRRRTRRLLSCSETRCGRFPAETPTRKEEARAFELLTHSQRVVPAL